VVFRSGYYIFSRRAHTTEIVLQCISMRACGRLFEVVYEIGDISNRSAYLHKPRIALRAL
jgi:hypothetical protein